MKKFYLLAIICVLLLAAGCQVQDFAGSRTATETQFLLEYSILNRTEAHEMELQKGTMLRVEIEAISGRTDIILSDENGEEIYRGNDASSGNFSIEIPETNTYRFSVTGSKAKGGVSFTVED